MERFLNPPRRPCWRLVLQVCSLPGDGGERESLRRRPSLSGHDHESGPPPHTLRARDESEETDRELLERYVRHPDEAALLRWYTVTGVWKTKRGRE
jgi:hypothetical protein